MKRCASFLKIKLIFFLFTSPVHGQFFLQVDASLGVVISDSDYNNGASGFGPGVGLGLEFDFFSFDLSLNRYSLKVDDNHSIGHVETKITSLSSIINMRMNHHPNLYSKLGLGLHNVKANYETQGGGELRSTIDGTYLGFGFGGGIQYNFATSWTTYLDGSFHLAKQEFSLFTLGFGFRRHF